MDLLLISIIILALLSPALGALIGIIKQPSKFFMVNILSFGAAVLLAIAFFELIPEGIEHAGLPLTMLGIIVGALLFHKIIPHMHHDLEDKDKDLKKSSWLLFTGVSLHNLPVGIMLATGLAVNPTLTFALALGLIAHNIPEGIIISSPFYKLTGSRLKAFTMGLITTLPLILGFLIAYFIFVNISESILGFILAIAAGVIIYMSVDELIPAVSHKISNHSTIFSFIAGILLVLLLEFALHFH